MSPIIPYLPWVALAIAVIAVITRDGVPAKLQTRKAQAPAGSFIILALIVGGAMFAGWKWPEAASGLMPAITGFAIGALLATISYAVGLLPGQAAAGRSAPIALAAAAVSFASWYGDKGVLALVFGAAAASWMLSLGKVDEPNPWAMRTAVFAGAIVALNLLSARWIPGTDAPYFGTLVALIGSIAGILAGALGAPLTKRSPNAYTANVLTAFL